jgi:hypothetical protein
MPTKKKTAKKIPSFARRAPLMRAKPLGPKRPPKKPMPVSSIGGKLLVIVEEDRMGNIIVMPRSEAFLRRVKAELKALGRRTTDLSLFLQGGDGDAFLGSVLTARKAKSVREGYTETALVDAYTLASYYGLG